MDKNKLSLKKMYLRNKHIVTILHYEYFRILKYIININNRKVNDLSKYFRENKFKWILTDLLHCSIKVYTVINS